MWFYSDITEVDFSIVKSRLRLMGVEVMLKFNDSFSWVKLMKISLNL